MQPDLFIKKVNEVYIRIECEKHLAKEISEHFTFLVPGYKFTPQFKAKAWDGKIRLYNLSNRQMYQGLLPNLVSWAKKNKYVIEYDVGAEPVEDDFSVYHAQKFFKSLDLRAYGTPISPRDHQTKAFIEIMQRRKALIVSPTASGKSLVIYLLFRQLHDYQNLKGLVIVPSVGLVTQLFADFVDYSSHNKCEIRALVHTISAGVTKDTDKPLTISTWQSLYKQPASWFEQFDYVIGDEAHQFKANELKGILEGCSKTKYRVGLTGSLDGTKTNQLVLEGLFGPHKQVAKTKDLMDKGEAAKLKINCLVLKHPEDAREAISLGRDYKAELEYLITSRERNKFIKNLALSLCNNTLILFQMVDKQGQILYNMIRNSDNIGNRKVFFVHGSVEKEDRERIRLLVESENDAIIIASYGVFSTGISIRNLHNIISASPTKSRVRVLQSIGRSLRLSENKETAVLYDIADDLRYNGYVNHTLRHYIERIKLYESEKFPYKTYNIQVKNDRRD